MLHFRLYKLRSEFMYVKNIVKSYKTETLGVPRFQMPARAKEPGTYYTLSRTIVFCKKLYF